MLHALINALALLPATTQQSQQTQQLNAILQQVQHFYGDGWHSLQTSTDFLMLAMVTITGVVAVLAPILINNAAEQRMQRAIDLAKTETLRATEAHIKLLTDKFRSKRPSHERENGQHDGQHDGQHEVPWTW